jgi:hypothetical protein
MFFPSERGDPAGSRSWSGNGSGSEGEEFCDGVQIGKERRPKYRSVIQAWDLNKSHNYVFSCRSSS